MSLRSQRLRESPKEAPHCMSCEHENYDRQQLCLAHSNALEDGRGAYYKTPDYFGAIICPTCHDLIDGRAGGLSKEEKREMHTRAWKRTIAWWFERGYLRIG